MGFLYRHQRLVKIGYVMNYDTYYEVEVPEEISEIVEKHGVLPSMKIS